MNFKKLIIFLVLALGIFLRLYQLDSMPPGLNHDEASHAYNAFSLLKTGKDRYGEIMPIVFRSFGTYLLPVYTYLTIIPVAVFGPTIFSARLISVLSSILLLLVTIKIVFNIKTLSYRAKFLTILFLSVSPWAVNFGRGGHEASLSVMLFIAGIWLFVKSLENPKWITPALVLGGFSGLAYYSERYLSLIILPLLIWIFRDKFTKHKKHLFIGLALFAVFWLPQLILMRSDAFTRRIEQVNYWNNQFFKENSGDFKYLFLGRELYIAKEFTTHYLEYFSPRSLFFDPDPQKARSIPDLSVFYLWMVVPLVFGIWYLLKNRSNSIFKIFFIILAIGPLPAALTRDPFYSIRVLSFLWILTLLIAFGSDYLIGFINSKRVKAALIIIFTAVSLIFFYNSYFILLKYERSDLYGYEYKELLDKLKPFSDKTVVVDAGRAKGAHIWIPFYGRIDPFKYQIQTSEKIKNNYYNNTDPDEVTKIDNFEIRPIIWKDEIYEDKIIVGDELSVSNQQIQEHKLKELFQIRGLNGKIKLYAFKTDPKAKCQMDKEKNSILHQNCLN